MLSPCNRGLEGGAAARGARGAQGTHDLQIAALGSDVERRATYGKVPGRFGEGHRSASSLEVEDAAIGSRRIGVGARACE